MACSGLLFAQTIYSFPIESGRQLCKMEFPFFQRVVIMTGVPYNRVYLLIPALGYLPRDPVEPGGNGLGEGSWLHLGKKEGLL